jgi:hypothetical protein
MLQYETQAFPTYDYTFTVEQLLFDQGSMAVRYLPVDVNLSAIVLYLPIWPSLDLADMKTYTDHFAPNDKWFAQETILNHGNTLTGTT